MTIEQALVAVVGRNYVFAEDAIEPRYLADHRNRYTTSPAFLVRPADTQQVAKVVSLAAEARLPITPLGGRTGVVGGGTASDGGLILSLERMNRILEIDRNSMTITVEAGVILQTLQEAAEAAGMLLPLDLGARGSATIGGNIATNAGGLRVVRWGMMRDMVLGLEAVLADGSIVTSLSKALKDNAGYNWKHLLVGSEGTLGIVTRAVLRLRPLPTTSQTALIALDSFDQAPQLLRWLEAELAGQMSSFELLWNDFYGAVTQVQAARRARPLPPTYPVYALVESLGNHPEQDTVAFEAALSTAIENELVADVVVAKSERERKNLWAVREELDETFAPLYPLFAFDVSMALADMPSVIAQASQTIRRDYPAATMFHYGHAGDGNLHIIVSVGSDADEVALAIDSAVYAAVRGVGGSISAEHGIGRSKRHFLAWTRTPAEIALMRAIKHALDPHNLLNPGKVLPEA